MDNEQPPDNGLGMADPSSGMLGPLTDPPGVVAGVDVAPPPGMLEDVGDPTAAGLMMPPDIGLAVQDHHPGAHHHHHHHDSVEDTLESLAAAPGGMPEPPMVGLDQHHHVAVEAAPIKDDLKPQDLSDVMSPVDVQHTHDVKPSDADTTDKDTSAMIAEAAAAAVASVAGGGASEDATAAALAVKTDGQVAEEERAKRNQLRRKRYREKAEEGSVISGADSRTLKSHEEQLATRRLKDRERYASMTSKQRQVYNAKRRDQYHRQSEESRQKRRERERNRYHSLGDGDAKERNARRAKLERERYQRLSATDLETKNRKRRERAAHLRKRGSKGGSVASGSQSYLSTPMTVSVAEHSQHTLGTLGVPHMENPEMAAPVQQHDEEGIQNSAAAEEAVKEAVKEAVEEACGKSDIVQI
ncbi:expressed unknown protein [Seminavis robusta]|uniref:Uncharacterized protein n=1 Tax=Seminavis robusta TaxID=568900 RepID=A0A9N8HU47_9STRA|nr:expressed unknown protein [Seminavis robusta]|eukprot:Sro1993_g309910.1 n/a (414) ;mRNA; f:9398-10639